MSNLRVGLVNFIPERTKKKSTEPPLMQSLSLFVKRSAVGLLRRPAATFSKTTWEEKEKSQEKVFFNKEEEKLLKKMHSKLQKDRWTSERGGSDADFKGEETRRIKDIFSRYRVSCDNDAVFDELYAWKYED